MNFFEFLALLTFCLIPFANCKPFETHIVLVNNSDRTLKKFNASASSILFDWKGWPSSLAPGDIFKIHIEFKKVVEENHKAASVNYRDEDEFVFGIEAKIDQKLPSIMLTYLDGTIYLGDLSHESVYVIVGKASNANQRYMFKTCFEVYEVCEKILGLDF